MRTKTIARWRRAALAGTLAASLAMPVAARAGEPAQKQPAQEKAEQPAQAPQDKQQETAAEQPAAKEQKADPAAPAQKREGAPIVTEDSARPPPDGDIKPVPGAPDEYVIQKGDTLWDLSQKFLSNPWYWPKIWSQNPSIENPHWIYPGNKLRIVPGEGVAQVADVDASSANAPEDQGEEPTPPADSLISVTPPDSPDLDVVDKNSREGLQARNSVSVSGKLAFTPPAVVSVRTSGLVTPEDLANAGRLDASFEEKEMLATYDTAYVDFHGEVPARPGEKMVIFRPNGEIVSPVTHRKIADQTKTVAVVKVLSIQGTQATVQVERTFEEVQRGDLVRPWTPQDKHVAPRANTSDVSGVIVQAVNGDLTTLGEQNEVFIDKGSADGVQEGNTFAVVRHGDGLSNRLVTQSYAEGAGGAAAAHVKVPDENVGLLLVVDAREHLSTAVVVKSVRELQPGDTVEMRASGAGGGAP